MLSPLLIRQEEDQIGKGAKETKEAKESLWAKGPFLHPGSLRTTLMAKTLKGIPDVLASPDQADSDLRN